MPSYMTLAVLALAASTVSPVLSAPVRVTREQALNYHEPVSGKRALELGEAAKLGGVAKPASKGWGSKIKGFALSLIVGGAAAIAGSDIYGAINPNSPALGGTGRPPSTSDPTANPGYTTTGPGYTTTGPGYTTTGPGYTTIGPSYATTDPGYAAPGPGYAAPGPGYATTGPGYATTNPGYATTNPGYATTNPGYATTNPGYATPGYATRSTSGTGTAATRAIAERDREELALDHELPVDISTRLNSNLNSGTSPHMKLLSRADLEKTISLFTRMLDELV